MALLLRLIATDVLVVCALKAVAHQHSPNLATDILPLAQKVNGQVNVNTAMWVQAWEAGWQGG